MTLARAGHLVDSQSFPCGSDLYPELAAEGAYSAAAVYSTNDLRDVVEYARYRGVRVMPEWDVPGHGSWGAGKPDVMGCADALDPTKNETYGARRLRALSAAASPRARAFTRSLARARARPTRRAPQTS